MNPHKLVIAQLVLTLGSFGLAGTVSANPVIAARAVSKGILLRTSPVCLTCHTSPLGGLATLRPGVRSAYLLDPVNLTRLKNLINGCPLGSGLNVLTYLCQTISVSETLGLPTSGTAATDVFEVTCGTGATQLNAFVRDAPPVLPALVSIQINKDSRASFLNIDPVDGDAGASAVSVLAAGPGKYTVNVNKLASSVGAEIYTAGFACRTVTGTLTGTTVVAPPKQDQ